MSDINVGVIGLGWVAGAHIETFKAVEGAQVTAACSRRQLDEEQLRKQYGIPLKAYQEYEDMLEDPDIDVIDICSPSPLHTDQAIAAARAGKDLIIEKPLALTYSDLLKLRRVIRETGVRVCVCFEVRFSEQAMALRSLIEEELLGEVHYGEVDYYHGVGPWYGQFPWNVKEDGGGSSLLSAGCHALDLLLDYMDGEVEEVTSYSTKTGNPDFEPYEYDTTSVTLLKLTDGRVGKVASVIDCLQPYYLRMHLIGSQGSVLDNKFHSEKLNGLNKDEWSTLSTPLVDSGDVGHHPYLAQFQVFADSLSRGEEMPLTDFETAFKSHQVVFAADHSAKAGRPVKLSELEEQKIDAPV